MNCNTLEITTLSKYCGHTTGSHHSWIGGVEGILCYVLFWNISPINLSLWKGN